MLNARWSAEAWSVVRVEFKRALALRSEIRRAGTRAADVRRASSWSPRPVRHTINRKVARPTDTLHTSRLQHANNLDVVGAKRGGFVSQQGVSAFEVPL
jgi:hypothetical protein